jgi:hypothetical protein
VVGVGNVDVLYLTKADFQQSKQLSLMLVLEKVPLLSDLADEEKQMIATMLRPQLFQNGELIVKQVRAAAAVVSWTRIIYIYI